MRRWLAGCAGVILLGASAHARPLSDAEKQVCRDAAHCADIIAEHGPSAFDYDVIAAEYARLGPRALDALVPIGATDARAHLIRLGEVAAPQLSLDLGLRLLASPDTKAQSTGVALLDSNRVQNASKPGRRSPARVVIQRAIAADLYPLAVHLLEGDAQDDVLDLYQLALGSRDPRLSGAAYQVLYERSPDAALDALVARMRTVDDPPTAMAIGQMLADRDAKGGGGFYARMLDDVAGDTGYALAMRDGARFGSLQVTRPDAPLRASGDLSAQLGRLAKAGQTAHSALSGTLITSASVRRGGDAFLRAATEAARRDPRLLDDALSASKNRSATDATRAELLRLALRTEAPPSATMAALSTIGLTAAALYDTELRRLARSHPFDIVRLRAQGLLERDVALSDDPMGWNAGVALQRKRRPKDYCERGQAIDAAAFNREVPLMEEGLPYRSLDTAIRRRSLRSAFPTATHWVAGYSQKPGGSLVAFDFMTGAGEIWLHRGISLVTTPRNVPLGQTPDTLFAFEAASTGDLYGFSQVWRVPANGDMSKARATSLPDAVFRAFRLDGDDLLLHFHDASAPFATDVSGRLGQNTVHPPLILTPDGELLPGCENESLVGEAPNLFRP